MSDTVRRVVTGVNAQGRSTVLFDDRHSGATSRLLWATDRLPADNASREDSAPDFSLDRFRSAGTTFMVFELPAGQASPMHATDTIDYIVVLKGRLELQLETGSVELGPGDCVVDRGVVHAWRALGDEPAMSVGVLVPARPVGAGATI
jgi:quercetin dioxygenase-like cupin family protein